MTAPLFFAGAQRSPPMFFDAADEMRLAVPAMRLLADIGIL
jgi:hypothetical protein